MPATTKALQVHVAAEEVQLIGAGLQEDSVRACVKVMGALLPLEPREQERVLRFVTDHFGLRTS